MKKSLFLSLLLCTFFLPIKIFSQEIFDNGNITVYLIGSVHDMHFNKKNHYSLNDLLSQVKALKPDLVCGEITPEAFREEMEGYFPPEAAFLAEMAKSSGYRFIPVDWRLDYSTQSIAENEYPSQIKDKEDALMNDLISKYKTSNNVSMYDFLHDEEMLKCEDSLYEKIIGTNAIAEIAHGSWHERNRRIVENSMKAAKKLNAKTIVFVFGAAHISQIRRQLAILGISSQIPSRMFNPGGDMRVEKRVLKRWRRNLDNLTWIREKKIPVTYNDYQKVVHSKRINDIKQAIQTSL